MHDDDELRIETIDGAETSRNHFAARLIRRAWGAWHASPGSAGQSLAARLALAGLTALLALLLVGLAGDTRPLLGGRVAAGADPILITPDQAAPTVTLTGPAPVRVGSSDWEQITLPSAPGTSVRSMVPSPSVPSTIFACTGAAMESQPAAAPFGPIVVWRTLDAGRRWSSLPLPLVSGDWCEVRLAADDSPRVTLLTESPSEIAVFLSGDEGDSWMRVTVPTVTRTPENDLTMMVWATAHHLYCWYDYVGSVRYRTTVTSSGSSTEIDRTYVTVLERSDDDGRTWARADNGLPSSPLGGMLPYPTRDENHLVTRLYQRAGQVMHADLWETLNAGRSWHEVMTAGGFAGLLVVPTGGDAAVVDGLPTFVTLDEQVPSDLYRLKVLARQAVGPWQLLPPLPVVGARADRTGLLQIYQQTDDGRLLAFGVDPHSGVPSEGDSSVWNGTASQWLWIYDQRVRRWLAWPSPLPRSYHWGCGVCLYNAATWISAGATHGTYLWVRDWYGRLGGDNLAYRVFVPDAPPGQLNVSA